MGLFVSLRQPVGFRSFLSGPTSVMDTKVPAPTVRLGFCCKTLQDRCLPHRRAYTQCDLPQLCDAPQWLYGMGVCDGGARGKSVRIDIRRQQAGDGAVR